MFKTRRSGIINVRNLDFIGDGATGAVFRLSKRYVIKVYCNAYDWYSREDGDLVAMLQELEAGLCSNKVLPIEDMVVARLNNELHHAAVKRYIPYECSDKDIDSIEHHLPSHLRWDLHEGNVRKDEKGKVWLIDSHLDY